MYMQLEEAGLIIGTPQSERKIRQQEADIVQMELSAMSKKRAQADAKRRIRAYAELFGIRRNRRKEVLKCSKTS